MRTQEKIRDLIEQARHLRYQEKLSVTQIAKRLNIPISTASNYSRGNKSSRETQQKILEAQARYENRIRDKLPEMTMLGQPIKNLHIGRGAIFRFVKKMLPSRKTKGNIIQVVRRNLITLGLEEVLEGLEFHYRDGKYYIRPHTISSKAFIPPYAELVLKKEEVTEREILETQARYENRIRDRLKEMIPLGYQIKDIHIDGTIRITFREKQISPEEKERALTQQVQENLPRLQLKTLLEEVDIFHRNGKYYIRPNTTEAEEFLKPYAELVLEKDRIK